MIFMEIGCVVVVLLQGLLFKHESDRKIPIELRNVSHFTKERCSIKVVDQQYVAGESVVRFVNGELL